MSIALGPDGRFVSEQALHLVNVYACLNEARSQTYAADRGNENPRSSPSPALIEMHAVGGQIPLG